MKSDVKKRVIIIAIVCAAVLAAMAVLLNSGDAQETVSEEYKFAETLVNWEMEGESRAKNTAEKLLNEEAMSEEEIGAIELAYDSVSEKIANIGDQSKDSLTEMMYESAFLFNLFNELKDSERSDLSYPRLCKVTGDMHNYLVDYTTLPEGTDAENSEVLRDEMKEIQDLLSKIEKEKEMSDFLDKINE